MAKQASGSVLKKDTAAGDVLLGASRMRLLRVLLLHAGPPLHLRALGRLAKVALGLLQRELKTLEQLGLVARMDQGRVVVFAVNRTHPMVPALREIALQASGGVRVLLREQLEPIDPAAERSLSKRPLYGDAIVVLIVSEVPYERWIERTLPLELVLGRPILLRVLRPTQVQVSIDAADWDRF